MSPISSARQKLLVKFGLTFALGLCCSAGLVIKPAFAQSSTATQNLKYPEPPKGLPQQLQRRQQMADQAMIQQSLAVELGRYGDRKRDPMALILAAQIQQRLNTQTREGTAGSVPNLLARAKDYAQGRSDLIALIDEAAAEKSRGAERGPTREDLLAPVQGLQNLGVRFVGGLKAMFAVRAEDSAKLVVEVLDPNGKQVCVINDALPNKECRWTPPASGEYQIRIRNVGPSASELTYFHN